MLNNMLGEEDLSSGRLDDWREGTRLSSMMAPTIILEPDGTVTALGTGGSNRISTAILQVAVDLLDHGMSLEEAVEAPRLHVERCGTVSFEPGLPEQAEAEFLALGDKAKAWPAQQSVFRRRPCRAPSRQWRRGGRRRSAPPRRGADRVTGAMS